MFFNETWAAVCGDYWYLIQARVVCRQLGFKGAVVAAMSEFGTKHAKKVWSAQVGCTGNEASIAQCHHHSEWGKRHCPGGKSAAVVCIRGNFSNSSLKKIIMVAEVWNLARKLRGYKRTCICNVGTRNKRWVGGGQN